MNDSGPAGIYLLKKENQNTNALKELLQFLRSSIPGKQHSFSYIEAQSSLHPNLSLWENLQIEVGFSHRKEFHSSLKPEWARLVSLLKRPGVQACEAQAWEKFLVSLLKGLINPSQNLLIDINEDLLSPFLLQHLKQSIFEVTGEKKVFLATARSHLWLDCSHTLIERRSNFKFETQVIGPVSFKKNQSA